MNEILNWAAQHNTLMIQVAFSVVLVLLLIYVYRLFFVSSPTSGSQDASSVDFTEVTQKLNQIIEQQKNAPTPVVAPVAPATQPAPTATSAAAAGPEVEQLKTENAKLKTQLNDAEKKIFELTPIAGPEDSLKEEAPKADPAQITELNKKIEELQSRLSEYDIIADDIAELSQLRAENAEMKKKLGAEAGLDMSLLAAVPQAEPEPAPQAEPEAPPEPEVAAVEAAPETVAAEQTPAVEPLPDIEIAAPVEEPVAAAPSAAELQESTDLLKSFAPDATVSEAAPAETPVPPVVAIDQNVADTEKNLMNEFEKSQKGS